MVRLGIKWVMLLLGSVGKKNFFRSSADLIADIFAKIFIFARSVQIDV